MPHSPPCTCLLARAQLDKLRTIIESMLASSSTLLSMSMTPRKILTASAPSQIDPETTCPACSLDLGHQVSMLVQRYEQLQDMVTNLAATRPSKKAKLQSQVIPAGLPPRVATAQRPTEQGVAGGALTGLRASFPLWSSLLTPQQSQVLSRGHSEGSNRAGSGDRRPRGRGGSVGVGRQSWLR